MPAHWIDSADREDVTSMHATYYVPADVHICRVGRHYVLLDLAHDRYHSIPAAALLRVFTDAGGYRVAEVAAGRVTANPGLFSRQPARELVAAGLLQATPCRPSVPSRESLAPATGDIHRAAISSDTLDVPLSDSLRITRALITAHLSLAFRSLRRIVCGLAAEKAASRAFEESADLSRTLTLARAFAAVRPYFPRNYLCLFDSLALLKYLYSYGLHPTWVFAVREEPFYAHCWVQAGSVVLNDHCDRVRCYAPIMAV